MITKQEQIHTSGQKSLLETENLGRTVLSKRVVDDITVQVQKGETISPYVQIFYKASLIPAIDSTFDAARMLFFPSMRLSSEKRAPRSTPRFSHLSITQHTSFVTFLQYESGTIRNIPVCHDL